MKMMFGFSSAAETAKAEALKIKRIRWIDFMDSDPGIFANLSRNHLLLGISFFKPDTPSPRIAPS